MFLYIIFGILSLIVILASCEFFTNAIELTGKRFKLDHGAAGEVFAAAGTALQEIIIPIAAVLLIPGGRGEEIATGVILGIPLMLSTLVFGIIGIAAVIFRIKDKQRSLKLNIDETAFKNDIIFFTAVYALAVLVSVLPVVYKKISCFIFLGLYVFYAYKTRGHGAGGGEDEAQCLYFSPNKDPETFMIILQDCAALFGMALGASVFVKSIEFISTAVNIPPFIFALLITPVAVELPEKFSSVMWIGKKKDSPALGNISGALALQGSFVVFVGIAATDWVLDAPAKLAVLVALLSSLTVLLSMKIFKQLNAFALLPGLLFYTAYLLLVIEWGK
jgi:cation:H+ antiporter